MYIDDADIKYNRKQGGVGTSGGQEEEVLVSCTSMHFLRRVPQQFDVFA